MSKLPLRDRLVVLTRPEGRGADWKTALVDAGAAVSELPLLEIKFEPDDTVLSEVLDAMGEYDWLIFTSANGVRGFFDRFFGGSSSEASAIAMFTLRFSGQGDHKPKVTNRLLRRLLQSWAMDRSPKLEGGPCRT